MSDTSEGRRVSRRPQGLRADLIRAYHRYRPTLAVLAAFAAAGALGLVATGYF